MNHDSTPNKKDQVDDFEMSVTINGMNGDVSATESDDYEDIKPRHPYDYFYLRHRVTVDSYGRKICTHEIPPTPSPPKSPDLPLSASSTSSEEENEAPTELENQVSFHTSIRSHP